MGPALPGQKELIQGPGAPGQGLNSAKGKGRNRKPQPGEGREQRDKAGGQSPALGKTEPERGDALPEKLPGNKALGRGALHLLTCAAPSRQGASSFPALPTLWGTCRFCF